MALDNVGMDVLFFSARTLKKWLGFPLGCPFTTNQTGGGVVPQKETDPSLVASLGDSFSTELACYVFVLFFHLRKTMKVRVGAQAMRVSNRLQKGSPF